MGSNRHGMSPAFNSARLTLHPHGCRIALDGDLVAPERLRKIDRRVSLPWLFAGAPVASAWFGVA